MASKEDLQIDLNVSLWDFGKLTREAVRTMAKDLEAEERADISAAGMQRFAQRTSVRVATVHGGFDVYVNLRPGWMKAWEMGAVSVPRRRQKTAGGQPLLWIPVPDGPRIRARGFRRVFGKLYRPKGKNVLISVETGRVAYIGIPSSTIQPVLHQRDIAEEQAAKFTEHLQEYS
jgi:hypothetical protein